MMDLWVEVAIMSNSNIHLISASAGSGKTYELMEQLYSEISQKNASPSSIMAVTFTNKAANELVTRVQQKLILQGESQLSYQMGAARIGTVHSICGNLLKSYAYEMGLSPELEIIDEVQAKELFLLRPFLKLLPLKKLNAFIN